ncbi:MAG: hypothetical protein ACOCX0_06750 [Bacteroidota bacterium]
MSKYAIITFFLFISFGLSAQDCDLYIPLEEGKGYQYQSYNQRDRLEGVNEIVIKQVNQIPDGTKAIMEASYFDSSEKLLYEGEYEIVCKGNELIIDMQAMMEQMQLDTLEDMEVTFTTIDNLVLPDNIKVGDQLPEGKMEMKISMGGKTMSEMTFTTKNRKVAAKETIKTPAGSYDCFKITYENEMDTNTMGFSRKTVTKGVEYFSPGVGNVRSEYYDEKDRLQGYTVLSEIY